MVLLVIALCNKRLGLEQTESGFLMIECRGGTECVFKYVCVCDLEEEVVHPYEV